MQTYEQGSDEQGAPHLYMYIRGRRTHGASAEPTGVCPAQLRSRQNGRRATQQPALRVQGTIPRIFISFLLLPPIPVGPHGHCSRAGWAVLVPAGAGAHRHWLLAGLAARHGAGWPSSPQCTYANNANAASASLPC